MGRHSAVFVAKHPVNPSGHNSWENWLISQQVYFQAQLPTSLLLLGVWMIWLHKVNQKPPSKLSMFWFGALLSRIDSGGVRVTWGSQLNTLGRVPRSITTFWRNWGIKHQTKARLHCQVVLQHGNWMQIS